MRRSPTGLIPSPCVADASCRIRRITSVRERLRLIVFWIEQFRSSWWYTRGCGSSCPVCAQRHKLTSCLSRQHCLTRRSPPGLPVLFPLSPLLLSTSVPSLDYATSLLFPPPPHSVADTTRHALSRLSLVLPVVYPTGRNPLAMTSVDLIC